MEVTAEETALFDRRQRDVAELAELLGYRPGAFIAELSGAFQRCLVKINKVLNGLDVRSYWQRCGGRGCWPQATMAFWESTPSTERACNRVTLKPRRN